MKKQSNKFCFDIMAVLSMTQHRTSPIEFQIKGALKQYYSSREGHDQVVSGSIPPD